MRHRIFYFLAAGIIILSFILASAGPGAAVDILVPKAEADSMKLGSPGQAIIVQGPPAIRTTTTACDGKSGSYPVQSVLVVDPNTTYISGIIVCSPKGLSPGDMITPAFVLGDHPTEGGLEYARYEGIVIPSATGAPTDQTRPTVRPPKQTSPEVRPGTAQRSGSESKDPGSRDFARAVTSQARSEKPPLQTTSALSSPTQAQDSPAWRPWLVSISAFTLVFVLSTLIVLRRREKRS